MRQAEAGRLSTSLEQSRGAAAQGDEGDAGLVEAVEVFVGGELGIEDEMLRRSAVLAFQKSMKRKISSASSPLRRSALE